MSLGQRTSGAPRRRRLSEVRRGHIGAARASVLRAAIARSRSRQRWITMMKNTVKILKRLGLMSSVGLIAISTATFASPSGQANSPVVITNLQIADTQQPLKKLPAPQPKQQTQQTKQ